MRDASVHSPSLAAEDDIHDVIIIGGGVNGCGIAMDAAGRGLKVLLCEQGDLASATSSRIAATSPAFSAASSRRVAMRVIR